MESSAARWKRSGTMAPGGDGSVPSRDCTKRVIAQMRETPSRRLRSRRRTRRRRCAWIDPTARAQAQGNPTGPDPGVSATPTATSAATTRYASYAVILGEWLLVDETEQPVPGGGVLPAGSPTTPSSPEAKPSYPALRRQAEG